MLPDHSIYMLLWGIALSLPFAAQISHIMETGRFRPTLALWVQAVLIFGLIQLAMIMPVALVIRYLFPAITWGSWLGLLVAALLSMRLVYISYKRRPVTVMKLHTGMQILLSVMAGLNVLIYTTATQVAVHPPRPLLLYFFLMVPAIVLITLLMVSQGTRKALAGSRIDIYSTAMAIGLTLIWGLELL